MVVAPGERSACVGRARGAAIIRARRPVSDRVDTGVEALDAQQPEPTEPLLHSAASASAEVIVPVVGEIDICTEPALARCRAAKRQPARHLTSLVVDMSSVTYIGVQGIAALLTAATNAQHRDVAFSVANCSPPGLRLLAVIDPDHTLTVRAESGRAGRPRSSGCARTRHRSEIRSLRRTR